MKNGIGGMDQQQALEALEDLTLGIEPIPLVEYESRIERAQSLMVEKGLHAIYLNAGTNLYYFTGTRWSASERMVGAIIPAQGAVQYIAPAFELGTLEDYIQVEGEVNCWQEHESPFQLVARILDGLGMTDGHVGIDESAPFFIYDGIRAAAPDHNYRNAASVTAACRMHKSAAELALLQRAKNLTLEVHKAAASILYDGISVAEVTGFIDRAHRRSGAPEGSYFCIVLFGEDTAYPHGVAQPKNLASNDMVLIDTGCQLQGYNSDITRSYVFGGPSPRQREVWNVEAQAQLAAFCAAQPDALCEAVDAAAREVLESHGFGPDYALPGLPHRTGHGIGLDIHEWQYLVRGDKTPLAPGMCFSNEPMLCVPGEFGVRLEDHFYMTEDGPRWFTQPSQSIDNPFNYDL
jgi:Xaa-Pro dipeptidase